LNSAQNLIEESYEKKKEGEDNSDASDSSNKHLMFNLNHMDFICMVMEIGQLDLHELLNSQTQQDDIKIILYNQLKALNYLHSANLIHRDIKPQNILIDQYSRIMICDFGMARTIPKLTEQEK
jgi:serine/threonine protein kinase